METTDRDPPPAEMPPMPDILLDNRTADELEASAVRYNVARIVRLTSGAFALFTHYRESTIDLIKVGSLEEIAPFIPSAAECAIEREPARPKAKATADDLLKELGL